MLKTTKICTLVLTILMMFANVSFCYAESFDYEITPFLTYISSYNCKLEISKGNAECTSYVNGNSKVTNTKIVMKLQKLSSGSWGTIGTWIKTGDSSCYLEKSKEITRGTYRLYCTFTADSETVTKKTDSETY